MPLIDNNPLADREKKPDEAALRQALGDTYAHWESLAQLTLAYPREWAFYKSGGWVLKVGDKKKALYYAVPRRGYFEANLTVREAEREALLLNPAVSPTWEALRNAKKYPEGFHMIFPIKEEDAARECGDFLRELMAVRGG